MPDLPSGISLLIGQADQFIWRAAENSDSLDLVIALENIETWDGFGIPCVTNIDQLINLAHKEREISRLVMLPDDIAGLCGKSAALIMIQAALERFQGVSLSLVSNAGPELVASLVSQGVTTVYLADQFTLLSDYPLPASRKRSLARLRRNLIRRYTIKTSLGVEILQVGLIDPRDWKPKDLLDMERYAQQEHNDIIRNTDARLAPTSEGLLASKTWSVNGLSCSELLRIYKRHLNRGINGQGSQKIGIERMSTWLGTRLPVVQGPMTRVSDSPAFAKAVAEAGAMPVIAAAMLSPKKLGLILEETSKICNNQPWGVGLLAFRSDKELKPQIEEVKKYQPNLIILAGGNPAQTEQFGELSDRAFLHSPTPELFEAQLAEGCRRFILEGRECGGHTGPCSSFALWEGCLQVLSQQPKNVQEETYILFAGGIHSKKASKLILELLSRSGLDGLIHGYLVGTLTLFSIEAVSTGAISPVYQNVLIDTTHTVLLETAPGHQSRCAITPFAAEFLKRRTQGLSEGVNGRELANILDSLILGRLRLASKGLRREGDQLLEVTKEEQINEGMFMVGETAALQNEVMPLEYLLEEILIGEDRSEDSQKSITNRFIEEPIAITGMAVALPGATTLASYWSMIIRSEKQIKIVPSSRWPADRYYSSESTATSVVSKWGTFIEPIVIDLAPYPITPAQAAVTEPTQIIALDLVTKALSYAQDISLSSDEREKTGVIFAASGGVG
ncbi:MAG: beta-ketoacyl synthase N-terminal-like domain-containing protein, partial [Rhodoluna sp.]